VRAVLDPNVIISALLSSKGAPAAILRAWLDGGFELVVSPLLLEELERALGYPKLRQRISAEEAAQVLELLRRAATNESDPKPAPARAPDPGDDYLIALAASARARLVSGDGHLLGLASQLPIESPAAFLRRIAGSR
jgi:putative PIN family toxin of toxin-antitoxin system